MTQTPVGPNADNQAQPKRLTRSREDRWLSGVCGGVARYAGIESFTSSPGS